MAADEVDPTKLEITDELIAERNDFTPGETPEDMTAWQRPITAAIDILNNWVGRITCLLIIPLIVVVVIEVFSRNLFAIMADNGLGNLARTLGLGPTLFAYDISRMIAGVLFMAAAGYGLMRGVHIRADFLYRNWSNKAQATVDASLYLAFFLPSMLLFTWISTKFFMVAYLTGETAFDSTWSPVLWPARIAMPIGGALLFLQGFSELFRAFHKMGKQRERTFLWITAAAITVIAMEMLIPDILPIFEWVTGLFERGGMFDIAKPIIGLIMLGAMIFVIFIGFPISFTLIFLAFGFGIWGLNFKLDIMI